MSRIAINIDSILGIQSNLIHNHSDLEHVSNGLSSVRSSIDHQIMARRNIHSRMNDACRTANELENRLNHLAKFIERSANCYVQADSYLSNKAPRIGLYEKNINDHFMKLISEAFKSCITKINVGVGVVVTNVKNTYAVFKKAISPGGKLYVPFKVGKAVVGLSLGIITVLGSGAGAVLSGGTATPLMLATAAFGLNSIFNNTVDITLALTGNSDNMGKFNLFRDSLGFVFSVGGLSQAGKKVGEAVYYGADIITSFKGAAGVLKNIGKFNFKTFADETCKITNIVTNTKDKLSNIRGIKKLIKAANMDIMGDIVKAHGIQDITKIKAIKAITEINYGKTVERAKTLVSQAIKPIQKIVKNDESCIKIAKSVYSTSSKIIKSAVEFTQDHTIIINPKSPILIDTN